MFFDPKTYEAGIEISGEEIERYYNSHPDEFYSEKTVQARHILFKLEDDADEKIVEKQKKKALEVLELAKKGRAFRGFGKKIFGRPQPGKWWRTRHVCKNAMVKPFADKAFSMAPGEISEPVRTQFGWHLIKVEKVNEAHTQSMESATEKIKTELKAEKARELALEKAEFVYDSLFDGDDLSKVKRNDHVILGTTDFFSAKNPPKMSINGGQKFAETAFGSGQNGDQ